LHGGQKLWDYAAGLLVDRRGGFAIADFWRFWVVHLWVEDFLELFTTIMVAYVFVLLGVVAENRLEGFHLKVVDLDRDALLQEMNGD
jgi:nitric oxide reductase large subunit